MSSVPLSRSQKGALERAAADYHQQIAGDVQVLTYLESRGLGFPSTIETIRFGLVRSPRPEHTRMAGRLAIPYIGPKGNVYAMVFRCIQDHNCKEVGCVKYLYPTGERRVMYNTRALMAPTDYLFVTEGEMDAATLTACDWPAVGIPGINGWQKHFARMMAGFRKVVLFADGDEAGDKLAHTFRRALPSAGRVIICQTDVNDTYVTGGKEALMALLKEDDE